MFPNQGSGELLGFLWIHQEASGVLQVFKEHAASNIIYKNCLIITLNHGINLSEPWQPKNKLHQRPSEGRLEFKHQSSMFERNIHATGSHIGVQTSEL